MSAIGCTTFFLVQLLAMIAGFVVAVAGLMVWAFTRFRSREALVLVAGALAVGIAPLLLDHAAALLGLGCGD